VRSPPLWARWALAIVVAVTVIATIVIVADRAGPEGSSESGVEAEINRMADILISEDEAPIVASLPAGSTPASALERAIASNVRQRIAQDQIAGPLQSVSCTAAGATSAGRDPYRCTVHSADIAYPFLAVVDESRQQLTFCRVDQPPEGSGPEIPISASCKR
jgi:hypothetical protein